MRENEPKIMAKSPSGHQFVVTKSPDREERYKVVETRVHERLRSLDEVARDLNEYKGHENVVLNVIEETKALVSETTEYGVDLKKIKEDFGRINVRALTLFYFCDMIRDFSFKCVLSCNNLCKFMIA